MKMIQVRNVPDSLHQALKSRAALERTTMSDLILRELPRVAHRPNFDQVMERIHSREPVLGGPSSAELIRAERDSR